MTIHPWTDSDFLKAAGRLKLHPGHIPRHIAAARAHLVGGQTMKDAGAQVGITAQAVAAAVRRIRNASRTCPYCGRTD